MSYSDWFDAHAIKHKKIVDKLIESKKSQNEIIEYFDFENMVKNETDFCPLYLNNKKCHNIESLNCYLCACPYFRFDDSGISKFKNTTQYSLCDIDSKNSKHSIHADKIHLDCSECNIPHTTSFIKKNFDIEWKKIMSKCSL
jgi:hypothetical protein